MRKRSLFITRNIDFHLFANRGYFFDLLESVHIKSRYTPQEFVESVLPALHAETIEAADNPAVTALDLARALALRSGVGASLFASPYAHLTLVDRVLEGKHRSGRHRYRLRPDQQTREPLLSRPSFARRRRTGTDEVLRRREPRNGRRARSISTDDLYRLRYDDTESAGVRGSQGVPLSTPTPHVGARQCEPALRGPPRTREG